MTDDAGIQWWQESGQYMELEDALERALELFNQENDNEIQ